MRSTVNLANWIHTCMLSVVPPSESDDHPSSVAADAAGCDLGVCGREPDPMCCTWTPVALRPSVICRDGENPQAVGARTG